MGFVVIHREFADNMFTRSKILPNTTYELALSGLKSNDYYVICVKILSTKYGERESCHEVATKKKTVPKDVVVKDNSTFMMIIIISASVAGVIIFGTIIIIWCKITRCKSEADSENKA